MLGVAPRQGRGEEVYGNDPLSFMWLTWRETNQQQFDGSETHFYWLKSFLVPDYLVGVGGAQSCSRSFLDIISDAVYRCTFDVDLYMHTRGIPFMPSSSLIQVLIQTKVETKGQFTIPLT